MLLYPVYLIIICCTILQGICCGDILLSLCYHSEAKTVEMVVIEINNLKKSDFIGLSSKCVYSYSIPIGFDVADPNAVYSCVYNTFHVDHRPLSKCLTGWPVA